MTVTRYIALSLISRYHCLDPTNHDISGLRCTMVGDALDPCSVRSSAAIMLTICKIFVWRFCELKHRNSVQNWQQNTLHIAEKFGLVQKRTEPYTYLMTATALHSYWHAILQITPPRLSRKFLVSKGWGQSQWLKAHLHYIQDLGPSLDTIKTSELMFHVYTDPSPCPRFLSQTFVSELVATCSDLTSHADVRVHPRLCKTHAQSRLFTWLLLQATKTAIASDDLGSEPRM